jgi:tetratricopeptide (TPR) repeat protein
MDCPHRSRPSYQIRPHWCFRSLLVVIAVFMSLSMRAAMAQESSPQQLGQFTIQGTVVDVHGNPVGDASVKLEQKGALKGRDIPVTKTNTQGIFAFRALQAGNYFVSAEKSGLRSHVIAVSSSGQALQGINLVLGAGESANSDAGAAASSDAMTFADKPDFTVAGITDWTAAGGHGSDTSLRTSESLARAAVKLEPDNKGSVPSGASAATSSESEAKLRAALARTPRSFEANHQLGEFYLRDGRDRDALPSLQAAFAINPSDRDNEYDLAVAQTETGNLTQAADHIRKLLAHGDDANLHRLLGNLNEKRGDSVAAVGEYEKAVRMDPSEQNYFLWGSELLLHRAVQPAVEVFKKGAEAHPQSARMLAALGAALFAGGNYNEAAQRLCAASDLNLADSAPYIFLGKINIVAPDTLACVEPKLQRFVEQQPASAPANYYYAMALWKRWKESGDPSDMQMVEHLLVKATEADPSYDEAYLQLGNFCSVERDFDKAIGYYTKAIELNPQLSDAHYHLGVAYGRTGETEKAKHEFQLHDEIEKQQAAAIESQRREIKQFLIVLNGKPGSPSKQ